MLKAPSTEIAKRFSQYREAAQHQPVGVIDQQLVAFQIAAMLRLHARSDLGPH